MPRNRGHALVILAAFVLLWPSVAASSTIDTNIERARAALAEGNRREAGRQLRAAADYLRRAREDVADAAKRELQASADEMQALAQEIANGISPRPALMDSALTHANHALAAAQSLSASAGESASLHTLFRDLAGDFRHLPSRQSLLVASISGGLAIGVHPFDPNVNQSLANDAGFFKAGNAIGSTPALMGASALTYGIGRVAGRPRIARVALDMLRAQIVTEAMVEPLKYALRRPRPDASSGYAFPSGHAAMSFATATVIARHHGWWSLPVYGLATYVAVSRLHDNVHYLSDVVFGAGLGAMAGLTVTREKFSSLAVVPAITPGGGKGLAVIHSW